MTNDAKNDSTHDPQTTDTEFENRLALEHASAPVEITRFPTSADRVRRPGRPVRLGPEKQGLICSLIAAGFSRRRAAKHIGCASSTITRCAKSDPSFADRLREAESHSELAPLGHLRRASANSWRAAAWLLERQHPHRYARRNPDLITREEFRETLAMLAEVLAGEVHGADDRVRVRERLSALITSFSLGPRPNQAPSGGRYPGSRPPKPDFF